MKETHEMVLFSLEIDVIRVSHERLHFKVQHKKNKSQLNDKKFTSQLYRLQQTIKENELFEKIVCSSRFIKSKFDKGGLSNPCNSE